MHNTIENIRVQYIPLNLQDNQNTVLNGLLSDEMEEFSNGRISQLYDIIHYLPIHDTKMRIDAAQSFVHSLDAAFWKEKCKQHCCEHIDVLEAFYSSLKRNNTITGAMFYGTALKGLVEIAYLSEARPYPYAKWLWNGLEEINKDLSVYLHNLMVYGLPRTCDEMKDSIYKVTEIVVFKLVKNEMVPIIIADSLLNP